MAHKQYLHFSNKKKGYIKGDVVKVKSVSYIGHAARYYGVQMGDLLYFVKKKQNEAYHATIITKVENGKIYYAGHTKSRWMADLERTIGTDKVWIVRIK